MVELHDLNFYYKFVESDTNYIGDPKHLKNKLLKLN